MPDAGGYIGAILAGGKGTRMAPFSERYPKPLLPVANKPLIQHQIEMMRELGIVDILLLIGHKGYEISRVFGDGSALGVHIRYVEQTQTLGIAHAVGRFEPCADRPMMLFLGDIFFVPDDLGQMLRRFESQDRRGAVLAAKEESDPKAIQKNFSMVRDGSGRVQRVIEKPRFPPNNLKGVGLYLFDLTVFDAIRRTPRTAMRDEYEITDSIQVMIDDGHHVSVSCCIREDINVTTPRDLLRCNLLQAAAASEQVIVGTDVALAPGATLERSVVGSHVAVQHPISIRDSLVFDHTLVACATDIEYSIVLPECIVDCKHDLAQVRENP
jgi:dTDP-glucose pyrophosphorylase